MIRDYVMNGINNLILIRMSYVKYLAFFKPPDISNDEGEKYSSLIKGMSMFVKERNVNPQFQLANITEDYMLLYKYKGNPFIKRILEKTHTPEEVVLLGYFPIFIVDVLSDPKNL